MNKSVLPESPEIRQKKDQAFAIIDKAFREVRDLGILTVVFDVTFNERIGASNISFITQEEWEHGIWRG